MVDGFVANGLVEAENRKGSGMMTRILEGTSRDADSLLTFSCFGNSSTQT